MKITIRTASALLLALVLCAPLTNGQDVIPATAIERQVEFPAIQYVNRNFPADQWRFFSGKKDAVIADTWTVAVDPESTQPMIICRGQPYGYIRTVKSFSDFELGLDWRFPEDANGNSGILLYTSGDDRIWPTSLQVQLHQPEVGCTFPSGGGKSDNELRNVPALSKPVNHWNQCRIRSRNGRVTVMVNGQFVGEVTGCQPHSGAISLQSEGSEIHFRRIWVRELTGGQGEDLPGVEKASEKRPVQAEGNNRPMSGAFLQIRPKEGHRQGRIRGAQKMKNALGHKISQVTGGSWRKEVECRVGQAANKVP